MRKITIKNAANTPEQVDLYSAFKIDKINKNFVIISKGEIVEGLNKIYISEVVKNANGVFDMFPITDENIWTDVKNTMKDIVINEPVNYIEVGNELNCTIDLNKQKQGAVNDETLKGIDKEEELENEQQKEVNKSAEPEIIVEENSAADFKVPELEETAENVTSPLNEVKLEDVATPVVGKEEKGEILNDVSLDTNNISEDIKEVKTVEEPKENIEEIQPETIKEEPISEIESEGLSKLEEPEEVEELPIENFEDEKIDEIELKTPDVPDYSISDFKEELIPNIEENTVIKEENLNKNDVIDSDLNNNEMIDQVEYSSNIDYDSKSETFNSSNTFQEANSLEKVGIPENDYSYMQNVEKDPISQGLINAINDRKEMTAEINALKADKVHLRKKLDEATEAKVLADDQSRQLSEELDIVRRSCDIYQKQKEIEEKKNIQLNNRYNEEKRAWEQRNQEFAVKNDEIDLLRSENDTLKLQISQTEQDRNNIREVMQQNELLKVEKKSIESKLEEKEREFIEREKIVNDATNEISQLKQQIENLKIKYNQEIENLKLEYNKKIESIGNQLQDAQGQINTLQHENANLVADKNQIQKQAENSEIKAKQAQDQLEVVRESAKREILAEQQRSKEKVEQIKQDANSQFEAYKTSAATSNFVNETTPNQQEVVETQKPVFENTNNDLIAGVKPVGKVNEETSPLAGATLDSLVTDATDGGMQRTRRA